MFALTCLLWPVALGAGPGSQSPGLHVRHARQSSVIDRHCTHNQKLEALSVLFRRFLDTDQWDRPRSASMVGVGIKMKLWTVTPPAQSTRCLD